MFNFNIDLNEILRDINEELFEFESMIKKQNFNEQFKLDKFKKIYEFSDKNIRIMSLFQHNDYENIKIIEKTQIFTDVESLEKIIFEYKILQLVDHENIIKCVGYNYDLELKIFNIYTEYIEGITLYKLKDDLELHKLQFYTKQILNAINHIHKKNIVHFDIKPSNIIVSKEDKIVLIDFGESMLTTNMERIKSCYGTICYMSPEKRLQKQYKGENLSDIWSLGLTLCLLFLRELENIIFEKIGKIHDLNYDELVNIIFKKINDKKISNKDLNLKIQFIDFVSKCLQIKVEDRWSVDKLLLHDFVQ